MAFNVKIIPSKPSKATQALNQFERHSKIFFLSVIQILVSFDQIDSITTDDGVVLVAVVAAITAVAAASAAADDE